jgi:LuxR family transcriptional regulator, maltose regulon positive regulatory protein
VLALLDGGIGRFGRHEDFVALLRSRRAAHETPGAQNLTARELELLAELPTLGTNEEIAAALVVSVNTVKTHLRSIYRKLGVSTRREAMLVARRRGLV